MRRAPFAFPDRQGYTRGVPDPTEALMAESIYPPARLLELAEEEGPAVMRDALCAAAAEIERLTASLARRDDVAARAVRAAERAAAGPRPSISAQLRRFARDHAFNPHGEAMRLVEYAATLEAGERADPLAAELASDAGVPSPMPPARRFAAPYGHVDHEAGPRNFGDPPTPGAFVYAGPALAVWRVLSVDELAGHPTGTHVLELEPVDGHDVPMRARVETVPMPVDELDVDLLYEADPDAGGGS